MKRRHRTALALCLMLAILLIASSVFMIHEADHDCVGEGCLICVHMAAAADVLRDLALLVAAGGALLALLPAMRRERAFVFSFVRVTLTPIAWKVRLNN